MYVTSARGMRNFARFIGDKPKHKGHCATITARVLKQAGIGVDLEHHSAWYCPSSLYIELSKTMGSPLSEAERASMNTVMPEACERTIDTLLRAPMSYATVRELGDSACIDAVRALTKRVYAPSDINDHTASRIAQKQLASVLLRWVLLREDPVRLSAPAAPPLAAAAASDDDDDDEAAGELI